MTSVKLVADNDVLQAKEEAKKALEKLNKKRKMSTKDKLCREYLRTFVNNPTSINYVLMSCGRADQMKRKEETV